MATVILKPVPTEPGFRSYKVKLDRMGADLPRKVPLDALKMLEVREVPYGSGYRNGTDWAPRGMGKMNG